MYNCANYIYRLAHSTRHVKSTDIRTECVSIGQVCGHIHVTADGGYDHGNRERRQTSRDREVGRVRVRVKDR